MTPEEMQQACKDALDDGSNYITLVLPFESSGWRPRLCKSYGPHGILLCCAKYGKSTVKFEAKKVLRFLLKNQKAR